MAIMDSSGSKKNRFSLCSSLNNRKKGNSQNRLIQQLNNVCEVKVKLPKPTVCISVRY
ncbi:hypothetical protein EXN66_Car006227 [Channa argus]|uniref:Uncharacterized protein n=1 Tax=Channa argus TaxID=215402 RepID=A0A6G1PK89_CHAAH|nr:hypothetical protein EXN66_Car006227 [Channa argus]